MHVQGNQLVQELLLKVSDTLHQQYRYIEHVHEEMSCQTLNNCFSNLAILYGICILDIRFLY